MPQSQSVVMSLIENWRKRNRRNRIYIIPTPFGFIFAACVLGMLMVGVALQSVGLVAGGMLLFIFSLLAMIETQVNIRDVDVAVKSCPPVAADDQGHILVQLKSCDLAWGIHVTVKEGQNWLRQISFMTTPTNIDAGTSAVNLALKARERGVYPYPIIVVASHFPFGIFRAWKEVEIGGLQVVFPKPVGTTSFPKLNETNEGGQKSPHAAFDAEYKCHKIWQPGETLHRIDWRASARRGVVLGRVYGEVGPAAYLMFSLPDGPGLSLELRLQQLSMWLHLAEKQHLPYGLEIVGQSVPVGLGGDHWNQVTYALATYKQATDKGVG
ncbi:MAG: hypothetical protein NTV34_11640 [Proteobacteria bacterium]|nr:hypothetical protein [Pseudomonadota bacterium]